MRVKLFVCLFASLLSACGGGGGASDGGGSSPEFEISGRMSAPVDAAIDSDTADATVAAVPNNTRLTAQEIRNPVTLGGFANKLGDTFDVFRVDLAGGQFLSLFIAEDGLNNDLDLALFDAAGAPLAQSVGTDKLEVIEVPGSGTATFFIQVEAFDGASNYVLSITQQGAMAAARVVGQLSTQSEFMPDQALVAYRAPLLSGGEVVAKSLGATRLAGTPGGVELLDWSVRPKSLQTQDSNGFHAADAALAAKLDTLRQIKSMRTNAQLQYAEPNFIRRASALPDDEFLGQQWHYNLINLPQAWDITRGSSDVIVAVADTGVRLNHPDLVGKFDAMDPDGFDFVSSAQRALDGNGIDGNADDPGDGGLSGGSSFHGTHVAGTIAAATNNGIGVAGAGWDTRIMPLRVLGEGGAGSSFDIISAVLYAARLANSTGALPPRRADILNLSLGGDASSQSEQNAYTQAINAGLIVIAAAGNSGDSRLSFPASYDGVVSVAAVGRQKQRAPYSQFNNRVDVAAPGGDQSRAGADGVFSTLSSDSTSVVRDGLGFQQGTSMAAPHIAGVVALMKAVNPNLSPAQLDQLLASGGITEDLGAQGRDNSFGHGLIDANRAVREAINLASGATPPDNPRLSAQPDALSFGTSLGSSTLPLDITNAGTGALVLTSIADDATWLTVSAQAVDSNGLGRYSVNLNRTGLANGTYAATIQLASTVNNVSVPVLMSVGSLSGVVNAGKQYVLLVDPDTFEAVAQDEVTIANGQYNYSFSVADGDYLLIAGTDSDNDDLICDEGEACGAFPSLDSPTVISVRNGARTGVEFAVSFDLSLASTQNLGGATRRGFRLIK